MSFTRVVDALLDRLVVPGYSRIGYLVRRASWPDGDPAPGALAGKVAVVTGASAGLGTAIAVGLARLGASVVMVVRSPERGASALTAVRAAAPGADVRLAECDVSSLAAVRALAATLDRVDVLVHNAGTMPAQRTETADGHEVALATHVLGPVLLTELLRPAFVPGARVVVMSSGGMYTQAVPADDPEYTRGGYRGAVAYARTKRAQVALVPVLAERYAADDVTVHGMHPGWADTPGVAGSLPGFHRVTGPILRTPVQGADTAVWLAATEPAPPSGRFWHDRAQRPVAYLRPPGTAADTARFWAYCVDVLGLD